MIKRLLLALVVITIIATLPTYAVKWTGNAGSYTDMDSITDKGNSMSVVYKYTNSINLEMFNTLYNKKKPLSVCLTQFTYDCATGNTTAGSILCYDQAGNVAIDDPNMNMGKSQKKSPGICELMRATKDLDKALQDLDKELGK